MHGTTVQRVPIFHATRTCHSLVQPSSSVAICAGHWSHLFSCPRGPLFVLSTIFYGVPSFPALEWHLQVAAHLQMFSGSEAVVEVIVVPDLPGLINLLLSHTPPLFYHACHHKFTIARVPHP